MIWGGVQNVWGEENIPKPAPSRKFLDGLDNVLYEGSKTPFWEGALCEVFLGCVPTKKQSSEVPGREGIQEGGRGRAGRKRRKKGARKKCSEFGCNGRQNQEYC